MKTKISRFLVYFVDDSCNIPPPNHYCRAYRFRSHIFLKHWVARLKYTPAKRINKFIIAIMKFIFSVSHLCMWYVDFYDFRFGIASSRTKNCINTSFRRLKWLSVLLCWYIICGWPTIFLVKAWDRLMKNSFLGGVVISNNVFLQQTAVLLT